MTEHEDNRVHYLVDACEVRGHLDIKPDDLSLILIHQRELGKEDALAHLAEHDKEIRNKTIAPFEREIAQLNRVEWTEQNLACFVFRIQEIIEQTKGSGEI